MLLRFDLQAICGLSLESLFTDVVSYNNTQKENDISKLALNVFDGIDGNCITKVWITFRIKLCFTRKTTISRGNINVYKRITHQKAQQCLNSLIF